MLSLADSNAFYDGQRMLPQHRAALTLIKGKVECPSVGSFNWLDLACGKGQVLSNIPDIISEHCCEKISYLGIDIKEDYCRHAARLGEPLFGNTEARVCPIDSFEKELGKHSQFDAITIINAVHELMPSQLAKTLVAGLCRLSPTGFLYVYDMETLSNNELGAIPWQGKEIEPAFHVMLTTAGEIAYLPSVAIWSHSSCRCWEFHLNREHVKIKPRDLLAKRDDMEIATQQAITRGLLDKFSYTSQALKSAKKNGVRDDERCQVQRLLNDFWSLADALRLEDAIQLD